MAWTRFALFADGDELSADDMNRVSENLMATMPGIASVANRLFYATDAYVLAETETPAEGDLLVVVSGVPTMLSPSVGATTLTDVEDHDFLTWGALRQTFKAV